ncbi:hypothetical protein HGI47_18500 [Novosphingobium sp. ERN07]|uniref:hypothetical protein n=1 Tax=Novosphingobium sp. ERN07 TaxID=2726187 RepID=UPI0014567D4A|nr:hypothetical protein [Novosphingobium sp. ERN07]NLR72870.1 hypothetical protein [Novosphingobium sp. ERN07]
MAALVLSLTSAGLAAVQAASGSDPVTIAELGLTATPFVVAPTLTALPGEFKRIAAVAGTSVAANVTHMSAYDTSVDVWNATGLGLWLADGTLFAVYSAPSTILNKAGPAFALVVFDIVWMGDDAASIAFGDPIFTNPPATTTTRGLVELATGAETFNAIDNQRAVTPEGLGLALLDMIKARDGIGSGLDADRFQGQDIGYFLAAAAYTAASVLSHLVTVDGSGSGLDADLLDGQQGSWYADIVARLGYTPLNQTAYTAADVLAKLLTVDGSGSGIDADLLDGHNGASYRRVVSSNITDNGGHIEYSDGFKETWGWVDVPANASATFNVPVDHTSWLIPTISVQVAVGDDNNSENCGIGTVTVGSPTTVQLYSAENFTVRFFIHTKGV